MHFINLIALINGATVVSLYSHINAIATIDVIVGVTIDTIVAPCKSNGNYNVDICADDRSAKMPRYMQEVGNHFKIENVSTFFRPCAFYVIEYFRMRRC